MPHHAPAEKSTATATRPINTLNAGRELPGRAKRYRNGKARGDCVEVVDSSFSDGISDRASDETAKGLSATLRAGNSTRAAGMTTGCASTASSASFVAEKIAVAGYGVSPVFTTVLVGSISRISIAGASATTGTTAS